MALGTPTQWIRPHVGGLLAWYPPLIRHAPHQRPSAALAALFVPGVVPRRRSAAGRLVTARAGGIWLCVAVAVLYQLDRYCRLDLADRQLRSLISLTFGNSGML